MCQINHTIHSPSQRGIWSISSNLNWLTMWAFSRKWDRTGNSVRPFRIVLLCFSQLLMCYWVLCILFKMPHALGMAFVFGFFSIGFFTRHKKVKNKKKRQHLKKIKNTPWTPKKHYVRNTLWLKKKLQQKRYVLF